MRAAWGDDRGGAWRSCSRWPWRTGLLLPAATAVDAPDALLGVAELVSWAPGQLTGLAGALPLLRPPRA